MITVGERHTCPHHPQAEFLYNEECPVEFVYAWQEKDEDKRQWLSGIVRVGDTKSNNLHNHDIHTPTKVPSNQCS